MPGEETRMRLQPCRQSGCSANVEGGGYCEKHRSNNDKTRDPMTARYHSREWAGRVGISPAVMRQNPICQKLHAENGILRQCHNPVRLVHHVTGARLRPDLFSTVFDPETGKSNLVALCFSCPT